MVFYLLFSQIIDTFQKTKDLNEVIKIYREYFKQYGKIEISFKDSIQLLITFLPNPKIINLNNFETLKQLIDFNWDEVKITNEEDKNTVIYILLYLFLYVTDPEETNKQSMDHITVGKQIQSTFVKSLPLMQTSVGVSTEFEDFFDKSFTEIQERLQNIKGERYNQNIEFCDMVNKYLEKTYPIEIADGKFFLAVKKQTFTTAMTNIDYDIESLDQAFIQDDKIKVINYVGGYINKFKEEHEIFNEFLNNWSVILEEYKRKTILNKYDNHKIQKYRFTKLPNIYSSYNLGLIYYQLKKINKTKDMTDLIKLGNYINKPIDINIPRFDKFEKYIKSQLSPGISETTEFTNMLITEYDEIAKDNCYVLYSTDIAREIASIHSIMQDKGFSHLQKPMNYKYVLEQLIDFAIKQLKMEWRFKEPKVTARRTYYAQIKRFLEHHSRNPNARRSIYNFYILDKQIHETYFKGEYDMFRQSVFVSKKPESPKVEKYSLDQKKMMLNFRSGTALRQYIRLTKKNNKKIKKDSSIIDKDVEDFRVQTALQIEIDDKLN
jgi:hypothetical protein